MTDARIATAASAFHSRLATLEHLLHRGVAHLNEGESIYLGRRISVDMFPLGAQVAFTCNQPRNFALWLCGKPSDDIDPVIGSMATAFRHISDTRDLLMSHLDSHTGLPAHKHLDLGAGLYADLDGEEYLEDFLLPNFYFHLVTSYAILRHAGVPLGKADYMLHLAPRMRRRAT
jgi:hypothetical protein